MELTKNAIKVLEARYLRRDAQRRIVETPEELFESVARGVAEAELLLGSSRQAARWEEIFLRLLSSLDFLPNTPTLMNAGKPLGQLSACFVLPVEDSMEEIFESLKQTALVQRTGGGTGFSFSKLRPKGDVVMSTSGVASGPVSFMKASMRHSMHRPEESCPSSKPERMILPQLKQTVLIFYPELFSTF